VKPRTAGLFFRPVFAIPAEFPLLANYLISRDKNACRHLTRFRARFGGIQQMTVIVILTAIGLGLAITGFIRKRNDRAEREKSLHSALDTGLALDDDGNVHAGLTYASMRAREEITGIRFSGREAEFLKLIQLISEGPQSADEIRFLLERGYEAVVRPDGHVYVPCVENEHLSTPGEICLELEDLQALEGERITGRGTHNP
jgi:hypothetical protein